MFSQIEENGQILVEDKPGWIKDNQPTVDSETLKKLVDFYVTHTPVKKASAQARSLDYYGWNNPWKPPEALNEKLVEASSNNDLIYKTGEQEKMQDTLESAGLLHCTDLPKQEVVCIHDSKRNQTLSLFYHIRNSFCHGRYVVVSRGGDLWLAAEDMSPRKQNGEKEKRLTARMVLRVDTLLEWIDIVTAGPQGIKQPSTDRASHHSS